MRISLRSHGEHSTLNSARRTVQLTQLRLHYVVALHLLYCHLNFYFSTNEKCNGALLWLLSFLQFSVLPSYCN